MPAFGRGAAISVPTLPRHHVIDCPRELDSDRPRHARLLLHPRASVKYQELTPFSSPRLKGLLPKGDGL